MKLNKMLLCMTAAGISVASVAGISQAADSFYFRLRPSVSIQNHEPFSVHIDGDKAGVVGSTFNAKAKASSPREMLRFSISGGALPPGISLDAASGMISGHPTLKGRFTATVKAEDAFSTASAPLDVQVYDALEISTLISQFATVGQSYSASFTGQGGNQSFTWSLNKQPPFGLSFTGLLSPTSILSGVPTTTGLYDNLQVSLSDSAGHSITTSPFSITVAEPLKITGTPAAIATVGEDYSASFTSSGGHAPISWLLASGTLPKGLSFTDGTISGIPEEPGTASELIVQAADIVPNKADSKPFSIAVSQPLSITGSPSDAATVGSIYSASFTASGGYGKYDWKVAEGTLPTGLTMSNGVISGTPSEAKAFPNIVLRVTDTDGRTKDSDPFSITVSDELKIVGSAKKFATVGSSYSATFTVSGGNGNNDWKVVGGSLPTGLSHSNGVISGTPTQAETSPTLVVKVTDTDGRTISSQPFTITVSDELKIAGSATDFATVGTPYSATFTSSGGNGNNTWVLIGDSLPIGLTFSNGVISGTPGEVGTSPTFVVKVSDTDGRTKQSDPFSITVSNPIGISAVSTPSMGTVGVNYTASFAGSGGNGNYSWSSVGSALPSWMSLSNGTLSGNPTSSGPVNNIIIRVTDANGRWKDSSPYSTIIYNNISMSGSLSGSGTAGQAFSVSMTATGGRGTLSWSIIGGSLPAGLSLANGTVSGTPQSAGTSSFSVRAADGDGRYADAGPFSITVSAPVTGRWTAFVPASPCFPSDSWNPPASSLYCTSIAGFAVGGTCTSIGLRCFSARGCMQAGIQAIGSICQ